MKLEILTPEKTLFTGEVTKVIARAIDGEIGILPDHAPLATILAKGEIKYQLPSGEEVKVDHGSGLLTVKHNHVVILLAE